MTQIQQSEPQMIQASALRITEKSTFELELGGRTVAGLAIASAWKGFTEYADAAGAHLIVLDAEQRVVTGSPQLLCVLGLGGEPQIGDAFEGGIYAGMTEVDGKAARLILLPGEATDVSWYTAMDWAKEQGGDLPTPVEQTTLIENLKSHFKPVWHWSREQHAGYSASAYAQGFGNGGQFWVHLSNPGSARAIRRSVI